jgi:cardiolipin synthase
VDVWSVLAAVFAAVVFVAQIVVFVLALCVIPGNRKPSTAMAWLILILAVPGLGILAFLMFGSTSVGRKRRAWQRQVNERVIEELSRSDVPPPPPGAPAADGTGALAGMVRLNQGLSALPMTYGNTAEVLTDYAGCFEAMRADVDGATDFVHVEFYISAWDDWTDGLLTSLAAAADRGVEVRLLFDHLGSHGIPVYKTFLERLRGTKIQWQRMLPIRPLKGEFRRVDLRNHRKILVVDGTVGWTGSQNLIEPGYNKPKNHKAGREWVELMVRLTGPSVRQLGLVFATDWVAETGGTVLETLAELPTVPGRPGAATDVACQVVPSGPGFESENNLRLFNSMVYAAQRRLSLTSPYFVPDESLLSAVTTAAQRGVDVELFVSEGADQFMVAHAQRSYYEALLRAGIRIWLYPEPYVLHAKHFTVDDDLAVIGSSNMDYRSFALNYEVVVLMSDPEVVSRMREVQDEYRRLSRELTLDEWVARGRPARYLDNVMRLTAALQ